MKDELFKDMIYWEAFLSLSTFRSRVMVLMGRC